jgi:hypothetical protein
MGKIWPYLKNPCSQCRGRAVQFQIGAVLQHSNTPSLRVAGFEDEDDDEDENKAPLYFTAPAVIPRISCREKII